MHGGDASLRHRKAGEGNNNSKLIRGLRGHRPMMRLTGVTNLANATPLAALYVFVC
jgi:hypothetical protein